MTIRIAHALLLRQNIVLVLITHLAGLSVHTLLAPFHAGLALLSVVECSLFADADAFGEVVSGSALETVSLVGATEAASAASQALRIFQEVCWLANAITLW